MVAIDLFGVLSNFRAKLQRLLKVRIDRLSLLSKLNSCAASAIVKNYIVH